MSREEFTFRECPSSVKEFSYKNNWRVFINGVEHHSRWQSRCLLESNIEIKVYTAEKQKQQTNQWNRRETRSSLARQGCGFHRCIRFSKLGNACSISLYERHLPFNKWDFKVGGKKGSLNSLVVWQAWQGGFKEGRRNKHYQPSQEPNKLKFFDKSFTIWIPSAYWNSDTQIIVKYSGRVGSFSIPLKWHPNPHY